MCGIAGLWNVAEPSGLERVTLAMTDALTHRGPDGAGVWLDREVGLAFGHRRLAIQDLSTAGAQPMRSASGRYVITYNGEVYNFPSLRRELAGLGHSFRGGSDTEVILAAVEQWGLVRAVDRVIGMFAFALWDTVERRLHLVRDRLGIKPLYVGRMNGGLAFASELASFDRVPGFEAAIDPDAVALYFRYSCVPGTACIFRGCAKLQPGTIATFDAPTGPPATHVYWSAEAVARRGLAEQIEEPESRVTDLVEEALRRAVTDCRVADVPIGVFLSGGIDSSTVTALLQAASTERVRTFSIGFREDGYDEASDARLVASHLGTEHTELYVTPRDAMDAVPDLAGVYSEPFADSSQLPTLLVCRLARREITVALSGDGGDEVFGGYNRHVWGSSLLRGIRGIPLAVRRSTARRLLGRSPERWDVFARRWRTLLPFLRIRTPGDKAHKLATILDARDLDELYRGLTSTWPDPLRLVRGAREAAVAFPRIDGAPIARQLMFRDLVSYLPDDTLTKVDRASMSAALEVRVPLLDHRVVELAWRLPQAATVRGGVGKRVLRAILSRHVPDELVERPKMGFGVPVGTWLRGPLRDWAEGLLDAERIGGDGLLDPPIVRRCWEDHLAGTGVHTHKLWAILMFQAWLDRWRPRRSRVAHYGCGVTSAA